ncbi:MAG: hypothetical protein KAX57_12420, partial [Rhodoferax sp.]|nr:hypothetical protein [Rhodoferax sp.]
TKMEHGALRAGARIREEGLTIAHAGGHGGGCFLYLLSECHATRGLAAENCSVQKQCDSKREYSNDRIQLDSAALNDSGRRASR